MRSPAQLYVTSMSLLQTVRDLENYTLLAVDGEIGNMEEFYFDGASWAICYLGVNSGAWLRHNNVLISPVAIGEVDEREKTINVELTRKQIEDSPLISTDRSLFCGSTAFDKNMSQYWQLAPLSGLPVTEATKTCRQAAFESVKPVTEIHLARNSLEVQGYDIESRDGKVGRVEDYIIDIRYWTIRYLEIDMDICSPGKHILLNPEWISEVRWQQQAVSVALSQEAIKNSPGFNTSAEISRRYELQLFEHYRRPVYWSSKN
jgi:hypothetical protein